ncbi:10 kDa chaperonin, mitochondrial-like [Tasmannia lanceolata]|uniref:10 kDa chaperonin, mitochondrial-like n=1 Tax=Tasmannia lanceolata TaxID=3420 RepID=UPI004063C3EE
MAKRLIPALNRVLVEKIVPPSKTTAGILLPEKTTKLNNTGKVVAVGPGAHNRDGKLIPVSFNEGDTVLLPDYGGTQLKLEDKEYHLFKDDDILGTLHD